MIVLCAMSEHYTTMRLDIHADHLKSSAVIAHTCPTSTTKEVKESHVCAALAEGDGGSDGDNGHHGCTVSTVTETGGNVTAPPMMSGMTR